AKQSEAPMQAGMNIKSDTCAVVVSYNPDTAVLLNLLRQLGRQCHFLLIDNHSDNIHDFANVARAVGGCVDVICQDQNTGLASAMNRGLQRALDSDYAFALLFDQDSELGPDFLAN